MPRFRYFLLPLLLLVLSPALMAQLRQVGMVDIPGRPGFDSMTFAHGYLVIAHHGANAVDIFDPKLRRLKAQITGMANPRGIAVDEKAERVYIANADGNSIAVLSTNDWKLIDTIQLTRSPEALLIVGDRLYIGNRLEDSVTIVDPRQRRELATFDVGGRPQHLLWDPATSLVFASLEQSGQVVAFDAGQQILKRYHLSGSQPTGLALDVKGRRLFVAVRGAVLALDADTGAELGRVPAPVGINHLRFDDGQHALYASATDGSVHWILTSNGRFQSGHELKTQVRGSSLAYDPLQRTIFLTGAREGRSKLVILKTGEMQLATSPTSAGGAANVEVTAEKK